MEQTETVREDSLTVRSTASVTVATVLRNVPGDSVCLSVPLTVMESLPDGALFTGKRGRTRVSLRRDGVNIVAEAESDSVPREVTRYEHLARDSLLRSGGTQAAEVTAREKDGRDRMFFIMTIVFIVIIVILRIKNA